MEDKTKQMLMKSGLKLNITDTSKLPQENLQVANLNEQEQIDEMIGEDGPEQVSSKTPGRNKDENEILITKNSVIEI